MVVFNNDWDDILADEFEKEYYLKLRRFLVEEYKKHTIYPSMYDIFNAMKMTAYRDVKAVILGQDPYYTPNTAHGLAFSVKPGIKHPHSLRNIFKELYNDLGYVMPKDGNLDKWANEGVLLLNTVLTVRKGAPESHKGEGWEIFTDKIIEKLNEREKPMVFILWGANAKKKLNLIDQSRHKVITGAHPSPLSAHNGFWNGRYFSGTNEFLESVGTGKIDWNLKE